MYILIYNRYSMFTRAYINCLHYIHMLNKRMYKDIKMLLFCYILSFYYAMYFFFFLRRICFNPFIDFPYTWIFGKFSYIFIFGKLLSSIYVPLDQQIFNIVYKKPENGFTRSELLFWRSIWGINDHTIHTEVNRIENNLV